MSSYSAFNSGCVTFSVLANLSEVFAAALNGLDHIEELEEVNDTVLIAIVLFEDSVYLFLSNHAVTHVFEHFAKLAALDGFVLVFVVVLEGLHNLGAVLG
jgi:hypothetical protein